MGRASWSWLRSLLCSATETPGPGNMPWHLGLAVAAMRRVSNRRVEDTAWSLATLLAEFSPGDRYVGGRRMAFWFKTAPPASSNDVPGAWLSPHAWLRS